MGINSEVASFDKKRKLIDQNEDKAQLDLLLSLGLADDSNSASMKTASESSAMVDGVMEFNTKSKKKKKKRRKNNN